MKTVSVIKKRNMVTKGNDLIAASYCLSVREQRLVLAAISTIYPKGEMPKEIVVTADFYSKIFGVANPWRDMKEATESIFTKYVEFSNDKVEGKFHWVKTIGYARNNGFVVISFHEALAPHLSFLSKRFSSYDLQRIAKLSSTYSIRLFEMLAQWRASGRWTVKLDELRGKLGVAESYGKWGKFKERVLDASLKEINKHSGLRVEYTLGFLGRSVDSIEFSIEELYESILASDHDDQATPSIIEAEQSASSVSLDNEEWVELRREEEDPAQGSRLTMGEMLKQEELEHIERVEKYLEENPSETTELGTERPKGNIHLELIRKELSSRKTK